MNFSPLGHHGAGRKQSWRKAGMRLLLSQGVQTGSGRADQLSLAQQPSQLFSCSEVFFFFFLLRMSLIYFHPNFMS